MLFHGLYQHIFQNIFPQIACLAVIGFGAWHTRVTTASKKDGLKGVFLQGTHLYGTTHRFPRSLKIYQKELDDLMTLIIRGCIPPLPLEEVVQSQIPWQFLNHHIFLSAPMKELTSYPTVSMVAENNDPVLSAVPKLEQQRTDTNNGK